MNYDDYLEVIHRTASKEIHQDVVHPSRLRSIIDERLLAAEDLDHAKKGLFYGRRHPRVSDEGPVRRSLPLEGHRYLAHAIIGIDTEAAELLTLLRNTVLANQGAPTQQEIADEAGDLFWYFTMLLKIVGLSLEDVMQTNFDKLSARFPEGTFSLQQWEDRDKEKEEKIMSDTLG